RKEGRAVNPDAGLAPTAPLPRRGWPAARIAGHVLTGMWLLAFVALLAFLISSWDPELIGRYGPAYLSGLGTTLALVTISLLIGALLSVPLTYARMSSNRVLSAIAYAYVYFFRGTPLLAQTFLIYYGLGSLRPEL